MSGVGKSPIDYRLAYFLLEIVYLIPFKLKLRPLKVRPCHSPQNLKARENCSFAHYTFGHYVHYLHKLDHSPTLHGTI